MPHRGLELEKVVALLEKLLDTDVEMKSPDYILGINSGSLREVDVALRKRVGSSQVLVIVEVRDRGDTEDVTWIEQIATKRLDVLAAKAVAVSSFGFSSGATNTARRLNIELRTIEHLTGDAIAQWFLPSSLDVCELVQCVQHAELHIASEEDLTRILESSRLDLGSLNYATKVLIDPTTGSRMSIVDAWSNARRQHLHELTQLGLTEQPRAWSFHVSYTDPDSRYCLMTDTGLVAVASILFQVELSVKESKELPGRIVRYLAKEGESIAESVSFEVKAGERTAEVGFHRDAATGDIFITVSRPSQGELKDE